MPTGNNSKNQWDDQNIMKDAVLTHKERTLSFAISAFASITPNMRNEYMDLLKDNQEILFELYTEMQKRSWYPVQMADQAQITAIRQKYQPAGA